MEVPDLQRIAIGVDPSGAGDEDNEGNDEIGIVVAGLGTDGNAYVLEDLTLKAGPEKWGGVAVSAYDRHDADVMVGETNFGGEMVRFVIQAAAQKGERKEKPRPTFKKVTASRGKVVRAEPVSVLTESGKVRFAGRFPELEEELCAFTTSGYTGSGSPNRADAMIWAISELFPGIVKKPEEPKAETKKRRNQSIGGREGWMG
jgi:predicted phage terminase large subunit-like protein